MGDPRVLLVYHTQEGQAAKVADRVASALRAGGASVEVHPAELAPSPAGFDGVILGDSIHIGRHSKELTRYAMEHADALNELPSALFQVSMTSASDDPAHTEQAAAMVQQFSEATRFDPDMVGLFAGALAYTRYGWIKRALMKQIAGRRQGATDTSRDWEYTDWEDVDAFAADVAEHVRASQPDRRS